MIKLTQRGALVGALAAACLCSQNSYAEDSTNAAPAADKGAALFADPVVAKGKGFEIKRSKLETAIVAYKASLAARNGGAPEQPDRVIEEKLLERLVITEILLTKATAEDKAKAKERTEKYLDDARKQFPSEEIFEAQVKASGMTLDQFRGRVLEQTTCETVLERELRAKIVVTDEQMKAYYDEHPSEFEQKEQVRASHVLISTLDKETQQPLPEDKKKEKEKLAKEIKARAEKGEDFAKLAKEYSDDPGSKDTGGEYKFPRGQMVKEFEAAAFSLKTNQVSDVVETRFGYHIIKLSEKIPASTMKLDEIAPKLKDYLVDKEFAKQMPEYTEQIKKEAKAEIVGEKKATDETASVAPAATNAPAK